MRKIGHLCAAAILALIAASGAAAQNSREPGAIQRTQAPPRSTPLNDRPPKQATPETEAWLARDVLPGDWAMVLKNADGVVFAKPAGQVRADGTVPVHLRLEYRNPITLKQRPVRSVQAEIAVDCGANTMTGDVNGFEGQNLSGRKTALEAGELTISGPGEKAATQNVRADGLKLINSELLRQQCTAGHQSLTAKYGHDWRPLLSDEKGVRLVSGGDAVGLDRKLDLKFRIEAKEAQATPQLKWRSAIAEVKVDCVDGAFSADATLFSGVDESGNSAKLAFEGYRTPTGSIRSRAPGAPAVVDAPSPAAAAAAFRSGGAAAFGDTGPGKTVIDLLRSGAMIAGECDEARAKLATALANPADPLRRQAETWASQSLNTKGFRLPTYVPEGVLMLSDEVVAAPTGRRALIRAEFSRPVPTREGKMMASRITVLEVDCAGKRVRGVSESTFAKSGAREPIKETPAPQALWNAFDEAPTFAGYFDAICSSKLAS